MEQKVHCAPRGKVLHSRAALLVVCALVLTAALWLRCSWWALQSVAPVWLYWAHRPRAGPQRLQSFLQNRKNLRSCRESKEFLSNNIRSHNILYCFTKLIWNTLYYRSGAHPPLQRFFYYTKQRINALINKQIANSSVQNTHKTKNSLALLSTHMFCCDIYVPLITDIIHFRFLNLGSQSLEHKLAIVCYSFPTLGWGGCETIDGLCMNAHFHFQLYRICWLWQKKLAVCFLK